MKKELAVKRNLDLLNEFMKYAFDNPEVMDKIPPEAELVILPVDDRKLSDYNKKMAELNERSIRPFVFALPFKLPLNRENHYVKNQILTSTILHKSPSDSPGR